jgi:hypothetical protein
VPRDFPQDPEYPSRAVFYKFTKQFAAQGAPLVSLTPVANGEKSSIRKFLNIILDTFG